MGWKDSIREVIQRGEYKMLPWECEDCGKTLQDSPFVTYEECPDCGSTSFYHGKLIEENIEEYNIFDDE